MLTAALGYARRGWKVFPCREKDETLTIKSQPKLLKAKTPYIGKWREAATTDEATIRRWWRRWPQAMIALPMGDNGLLALDFDPRTDADTGEVFKLVDLKAATEEQIGCALPISLASLTQSDGVHVIYNQPAGEPITNRGNLPRHVDVRGKGGYIIAPPSILYREDGSEGRYRWIEGRQDVDPVDPPAALVEALRSRAKRSPANGAAGSMPASSSSSALAAACAETEGFWTALQLVLENGNASTSWLQRQMRIGYNSAARLIEQLERYGAVSVPDGLGRREVTMTAAELAVPPSEGSPPAPSPRTSAKLADASEAVRKYALAALQGECDELAATPKGGGQWGGRNQGIFHAALKMGSLAAAGAISEYVVRAAIQGVIDKMPGNDDPEGAKATLERGLSAGAANPRDLREIEEAARARASRSRASSSRLRPPPPASGEAPQSFRAEGTAPDDVDGGGGEPRYELLVGDDEDGGGDDEEADAAELNRRCLYYPHTDLGNAERFRERYGRDFRWSPALGWMGWDGMRWLALDQDEKSIPAAVMQAVFDTVRAIQDEALYVAMSGVKKPDIEHVDTKDLTVRERKQSALFLETGEQAEALDYVIDKNKLPLWSDEIRKWGRTSEAQGKLTAIASIARSWLAVRVDQFDADPLAINVLNGTLRFSKVSLGVVDGRERWKASVSLTKHRRKDMLSKLAPVVCDPCALCDVYDDMLEWAQPKLAMRRYIHAWGGLSMTSETGLQILQFWYGLGGNGKSTVMDMWCEALGDYSDTIPIESFLDQGIKKRGDQASPDLAKLGGVRLLRTSEPDEGAKLSTGLIKLVTGGEPVPVRHLNRGFFNLKIQFKLTVQGNHKPEIRQTDDGIWRRVKLVHWGQRVKDEMNPHGTRPKDPYLKDKMRPELSGIFNHLVLGLLDYLENGLVEAEDVTSDTMKYRTENDPLQRFLNLCTAPDAEGQVRSSKLYELFQAWCKVADETEWKQKGFSRAMLAKGYQKKQSDGMHWLGIRMTREPSEFVDPQTGRPTAFSLDEAPAEAPPHPPPEADRAPGWGDIDPLPPPDDDEGPL